MKDNTIKLSLPNFSLCAGLLGLALRIWYLTTGTDRVGLYRVDHPANVLTYLLVAAVALELFIGLRPLKRTPNYERMFPRSIPAALGSFIAAAGILFSALQDRTVQSNPLLSVACLLSGLLAAGALLLAGLCRYRGRRPNHVFHGVVTVYLLLHLVNRYSTWSNEPQLSLYLFPLLSCIAVTLSTYYRACLDGGLDTRKQYTVSSHAALFLCCTCAAGESWYFYGAMALWLFTMELALDPLQAPGPMHLPTTVQFCLDALNTNGYTAYVVGGCVRNSQLGLRPKDYDMCTNATPQQIATIFSNFTLVRAGEKHGTIGVVLDNEVYEITTFRTDGAYSDGRHPDWVEFVSDVERDLARRDFTVNAIAYSPEHGYIDPFAGQQDLDQRILRAVRDPEQRFREDPLRILRGVRFAVTYRLKPEPKTALAMEALVGLLDGIAVERVFAELCKLIIKVKAKDLLRYTSVITQIIPELLPAVDFDQHSPHHAYDVYTHTAHVTAATAPHPELRLAALLHDVGKPATFFADANGRGHFYDHARVGAEMADRILLRLKAPTQFRETVVFLIENHMTPLSPDKKQLRHRLSEWGEERLRLLLALQKADFASKGVAEDEPNLFPVIEAALAEVIAEDSCLTVKQLAINGYDLISLGVAQGPHIGKCMNMLLGMVLDESVPNEREALLRAAREYLEL